MYGVGGFLEALGLTSYICGMNPGWMSVSWTMSLAERCVRAVRGLILYLRVLRGEFRRRRGSVLEHRC